MVLHASKGLFNKTASQHKSNLVRLANISFF